MRTVSIIIPSLLWLILALFDCTISTAPLPCKCDSKTKFANCSNRNLTRLPQLSSDCIGANFSNNRISVISKSDLKNATGLLRLYLANNQLGLKVLANLSFVVNRLKKLQRLDLSNNALQRIPAFSGAKLKEVFLNDNKIVPYDKIRLLNDSWTKCTGLIHLDLSGNSISTLFSTSFKPLKGRPLANLNLSRNALSSIGNRLPIDPMAFDTIGGTLRTLDLSNNKLDEKSLQAALSSSKLNHLETLNLTGLPLTTLTGQVFGTLSKLKELVLANNSLTGWDAQTFNNFSNLARLDVSHNQIVEIDSPGSLNSFGPSAKTLKNVKLGHNPFNCTCQLVWLRDWITKVVVEDRSDMICQGPKGMDGKKVANISLDYCYNSSTTATPTTTTTMTTTTKKPHTTTTEKPHTTTTKKPHTTTTIKPNTTPSPNPHPGPSHHGFPWWGILLLIIFFGGILLGGIYLFNAWRRRRLLEEGHMPIIGEETA